MKHNPNEQKLADAPPTFASSGMLDHADENLQFASEELLRMEDEGGTPLTNAQTASISRYAKARAFIKSLLSARDTHRQQFKVTQENSL